MMITMVTSPMLPLRKWKGCDCETRIGRIPRSLRHESVWYARCSQRFLFETSASYSQVGEDPLYSNLLYTLFNALAVNDTAPHSGESRHAYSDILRHAAKH